MPLSSALPEAVLVQEEPFGDPSIIAHGLLMDAAKRAGVPVVLGGQGGDELLFGYLPMRDALISSSLRGGRARWGLSEARAAGVGGSSLARVGLAAVAPAIERRARQHSRRRHGDWLSPSLQSARLESVTPPDSASSREACWLYFVEQVSLPHLTHYDDRNGMARSIEGRMPFLDHRLADEVSRLDESAFLSNGRLKRILRDACADLLPDEVSDRRDKIGFYTPLREMLAAEVHWAREKLSDDLAHEMGLFDCSAALGFLETGKHPDSHVQPALRAWRALSVRVWAEAFSAVPDGA